MKILLGDFKKWRIKRVSLILAVMIVIAFILYIINISRVEINTAIFVIALIVTGLVVDSQIFRKEYITECTEKDDYIYIKNEKVNYKINKKDIRSIYYKEIVYGGRSLDVVGFRLVLFCKDKKYVFDSIYQENAKWEETDLVKLYNILTKFMVKHK